MPTSFRVILFLISINCAMAQVSDGFNPVPMTKMVLKQWTGEDGLISNNLTSVNQTNDGFIWITTFNGLHRFDGAFFKLYDKENVNFLKTNAFYSVTSDGENVILASRGTGLLKYEDGFITPMPEFAISTARTVLVDSKGRYWCGTNNEGVLVKENGKVRKINFTAFDQVVILDIYEDRNGRIWFGTEGNGLVLFDNDELIHFDNTNLLNDITVTSILQLKDGPLLIGTPSGLYRINDEVSVASPVRGLQDIYVNDLTEDVNGMIWIGTENGLFRAHLKTGYFDFFDESKGLPSNQISSVVIDHEESIWLSTKKAGLFRMNLGSIITFGESDGISPRINSIVEDKDRVFIGSDDGSAFIKDKNGVTSLDLSTKKQKVGVRDFMIDDEVIWVASYLGLHRYANGKEKIFTTDDGLSSNLIRRILPTTDGSMWLASRSGGVMRLEDNMVVDIYNTDNGMESNFALSLAEDKENNLVVGTLSGGISIIRDDTVNTFIPEIGGVVIFNIYVDDNNRYWLSTSVGLFLFENETFRQLKFDTSFKIEAVFDFVPDLEGNVWLPTVLGIVRIRQDQLAAFTNGLKESVEGTIFDNNDGMSNKECTGATRSTRLANGNIWVPTLGGVAVVEPKNIRRNAKIPKIVITDFIVDDSVTPIDKKNIEPGKLRYEFDFSSASFLAPERVLFRYKLSGVDNDWITTSERRIEYTNLSPGTYTFSVIGSNNDGLWNETGDSRTFVVEPFFYQTLLFKILIALSIVIVFYFIFVWRVGRIKAVNKELTKVNEELDRFVYSASHDIRAPLTSILGAANIGKSQETVEEKDHSLDMIETSAKKLDGFIRDIIDYSRNQRLELVHEDVNLKVEVESVLESLKYLNEDDKITCNINSDCTNFKTDVRRLRVILKNIIANAIFYYDPSKPDPYVTIDCELDDSSSLVIRISDNGLGIREEVLTNIFTMFYRGSSDSKGSGLGLYIAKENIEKLKGTIEVHSELHKGTTFTIVLPVLDNIRSTVY